MYSGLGFGKSNCNNGIIGSLINGFLRIIMQDGMSRKDDPNDYVVVDPLLEKGKEKFNRMQAKQKRREREWAGKSLTWSS